MEVASAVLTIGEIALGLAGFSSVLIALSGRPKDWTALDSFRITWMLSASLSALMLSLLPFVIRFLGAGTDMAWRSAAGVAAFVLAVGVLAAARSYLRLPTSDRTVTRPVLAWTLQAMLIAASAALFLAAIGLVAPPEGIYLLGLFCLVGLSCYLIVRFLFARPGH